MEYLADREGLVGAGREKFIALLRDAFGFGAQRPKWDVAALSAWVAMVTLAGIAVELNRDGRVATLMTWLGVGAVGVALVFALARSRRRSGRGDREIDWRAYCLVIRPMILAERPGLLDRNLAAASIERQNSPLGTVDVFRDVDPVHLWLPAAVGWALGAVPLLLWHFAVGAQWWMFLLPPAGTILLPFGWGLFRLAAYVRVERAARERL